MPSYRITTPDGQKFKITADTDEAAQAAINDLLGQSGAAKPEQPKQEMVGFGDRSQREQDMPLDQEAQDELAIAKQMAMERQMPVNSQTGATGAFLGGARQGLSDEVSGVASALSAPFNAGRNAAKEGKGVLDGLSDIPDQIARQYHIGKEVSKRLAQEFADKNPGTATALNVAGSIASIPPLRQSLLNPSLGRTMLEGAKAGATAGAIGGFGEGEGATESAIGAGVGGVLGGALGGAVPAISHGIGLGTAKFRNAYRAIRNPEEEGLRRVGEQVENARATGGWMDDAEFNRLRQEGVPLTTADRSAATQRMARAAADQDPQAAQTLDNVLDPRYASEQDRLDNVLSQMSRRGGNPEQHLADAEVATRAANSNLYGRAYDLGADSIWDDTLEGLAQTPAMQEALRRAVETWRNKAPSDPWMRNQRMMNPPVSVNEVGDLVFERGGLPAYPNLRLWDLAKQELDDMVSSARTRGERGLARDLGEIVRQLRDHLDSMGDMGRAYQTARSSAALHFGAENAYEAGLAFFRQEGFNARQAMRGWARLSADERALLREGYVQALRDEVARLRTNRDAAANFMASPSDRAKARLVLGPQDAERFQRLVNAERRMTSTRREVQGGSRTNRYQQARDLVSASGTGAGIGYFGSGDQSSVTIGAIAGAATKLGQRAVSDRLARHIATILMSTDTTRIEQLMRQARRSPVYRDAVQAVQKAISAQLGASAGVALGSAAGR